MSYKDSKFYVKTPFKERVVNFMKGLLFWKGRKKGIIHTRNLEWNDIREIFFPKDFYEKYSYLGAIPYNEDGDCFKAIYPLILAMDHEAKPKWCPRWFLRFLDVFGNDSSIVRVRNRTLHDLYNKITKGIRFIDYKTKWWDWDLRISINGPEHLQNLADDIEHGFYNRGHRQYLENYLKKLDPEAKPAYNKEKLIEQIEKLEDQNNNKNI